MAKVLVVVKVFPEDTSVNLDELKRSIAKTLPPGYEIVRSDEEPIAFGLKALKLYVVMEELTEGGTSKLEEVLRQVPGVSEIEVEAVHRISSF